MTVYLYEKQEAPDEYVLDVTPGPLGADLTLVDTAVFRVLQNNNLIATWAATLSNQTATTLTLTHVLAAGGLDVPERGTYTVFARLALAGGGGFVRTQPRELVVRGEFEV